MSLSGGESCVALVTNRKYLRRCFSTVWQLRFWGRYRGEVVVIVGDDLAQSQDHLCASLLKLTIVHFPDFPAEQHLARLAGADGLGGMEIKKNFQYHKFHLFSPYFSKYDKVLYVDAGMRIMHPVSKIFEIDCKNKIVAHSDSYPDYKSTLEDQFNFVDFPHTREEIRRRSEAASDYFQTTMMLFDPVVGGTDVIGQLQSLRQSFPNSKTNDQGLINLWALQNELWRPLPTTPLLPSDILPYDFHERGDRGPGNYVMLKYPKKTARKRDRITDALFDLYWWGVKRKLNRDRLGLG